MTWKNTKIGIKVNKIGVSCNDKEDLNVTEFDKTRYEPGSKGFALKPAITHRWPVTERQK